MRWWLSPRASPPALRRSGSMAACCSSRSASRWAPVCCSGASRPCPGARARLRDNNPSTANFLIEGVAPQPGRLTRAEINVTSSDFFRAMGVPLMAGRALEERDAPPGAPAVAVNQSFARRWFGGRDPIGQRLSFDDGKSWAPIVGIAADVKQHGLEAEPADEIYLPLGGSSDLR